MATVPLVHEFPLSHLPAGMSATVVQVLGAHDHVHRLHELGLQRGAALEMIQPGDPCIVRLHGAKYCFRGNEALRILVAVSGEVP